MKELRELARLATSIADKIEDIEGSVQTEEQFTELQLDINEISTIMGKNQLIINARVCWFNHGLNSFEQNFVQPIVNNEDGWAKWHQSWCRDTNSPPNIIMHWNTLQYFLRRTHLGNEAFVEMYQRVENMLNQLMHATKDVEEIHNTWNERLKNLRKMLIEGRY